MKCLLEESAVVSGPAPQTKPPIIEVLHYPTLLAPELLLWEGIREIESSGASRRSDPADRNQQIDRLHAEIPTSANPVEQARRSFEAGRQQGVQEGRELERQEHSDADQAAKTECARHAAFLVRQFDEQRERYFQQAESAIARLAFAIAERILCRESAIDPLCLTATVREALSQLAANTEVRLHVPAADADLWKEHLEHAPELKIRPKVIGDEQLQSGDCAVETELGFADIGIHAQLAEIVRSLFNDSPEDAFQKPQPRNSEAQR